MAEIIYYRELEGLPEELEKWCKKALSKIESPEKRHEAAKDLREKIEKLMEECSVQDMDEKIRYALLKLGNAETEAEELKQIYELPNNKKADQKAGTVCLILGIICGIISLVLFFSTKEQSFFLSNKGYIHGAYKAGVGVGAAAVVAIILIITGIRLLIYSRKKQG